MKTPPDKIGLYKLKQPKGETYIWSWWDDGFHGAWPSMEYAVIWKNWNGLGCALGATAWRGVLK